MRGAVSRAAAHASSASSHSANGKALCTRCGFIKRARLEKVVAFPPPPSSGGSTAIGSTPSTTSTINTVFMHHPDRPLVVKCVYISWCACLGTLARLYTDEIRPSNIALQGSLLANSIGSFTLGMLTASDLGGQESLAGLYTGLTVGLCGSYTTFSGWNLRIARGALRDTSGPGGAIVAIVSVVQSLAFFAACFVAGKDLIKTAASRGMLRWRGNREALSNTSTGRAMGVIGCVYALLTVLLCIDDNRSRRIKWMACVFAPFGALSRFYLSRSEVVLTARGRFAIPTTTLLVGSATTAAGQAARRRGYGCYAPTLQVKAKETVPLVTIHPSFLLAAWREAEVEHAPPFLL